MKHFIQNLYKFFFMIFVLVGCFGVAMDNISLMNAGFGPAVMLYFISKLYDI